MDLSTTIAFDQDIYQILKQFIKKQTNHSKIKQLPSEKTATFMFEEFAM